MKIRLLKIKDFDKADKLLDEYTKIENILLEHPNLEEENYINIVEPTSGPMKSGNSISNNYNVQVITNNQIITINDISMKANDQHEFQPIIEQFIQFLEILILRFSTKFPKFITFLADAGYNMGANLSYADKIDIIDFFISMNDRSRDENDLFDKENLTFNENQDVWICPENKKLEFLNETIKDGKKKILYGCNKESCIFCQNYKDCVTTKKDISRGYRTIDDDQFIVYRNEMREKVNSKKGKEIYSKRAPEVEPVFGQIKFNKDITRFLLKGLEKVKGEFNLISLTHNMNKIMRKMKTQPHLLGT